MKNDPMVFIVDDDREIRESLTQILFCRKVPSKAFARAEDFLSAIAPSTMGCVLLDLRLAGMSGLEALDELKRRGSKLPVVILSGHADVPTTVHACRAGAIDVLEKPIDPNVLVERLQECLEQDRVAREAHSGLEHRLGSLSSRQREVLEMLMAAKTTKEIARAMELSPKTVEKHRGNVLRKMGARSVVELVRMVLPSKC